MLYSLGWFNFTSQITDRRGEKIYRDTGSTIKSAREKGLFRVLFLLVSPVGIEPTSKVEMINNTMLKCINCSNDLFSKFSKKFCNRSCSASYNNRLKIKHGGYAEKQCLVCSKITTSKMYCSTKCAGIAKTKYVSDEDKLKARRLLNRESYSRYSAKKKYQTPIDENLRAIKEFYKNCPIGYEVDHIIPISKGGPHSLSNLQYLTSADNRKKSAKLDWRPEGDSNA